MYFGLIVPAYGKLHEDVLWAIVLTIPTGYAYFAPTIIKTYGYGSE